MLEVTSKGENDLPLCIKNFKPTQTGVIEESLENIFMGDLQCLILDNILFFIRGPFQLDLDLFIFFYY